jgi:hypothetical protein
MAANSGNVKTAFEKYAKFGKTEAQLKELKASALRIETRNIQKMFKETGILDSKYTPQLLDNDISNLVCSCQNLR